MKHHVYGVYNIDTCNFSFSEEERKIYHPEIDYTHSGLPFYMIIATWFQYMKLRLRFWYMKKRYGSRLRIRLIQK
jgi:hypothetical protein